MVITECLQRDKDASRRILLHILEGFLYLREKSVNSNVFSKWEKLNTLFLQKDFKSNALVSTGKTRLENTVSSMMKFDKDQSS